jgi:5-deoxy-glucuronate isomerase
MSELVRSDRSTGKVVELEITPESAGWGYSGLTIISLQAGGSHAFSTGSDEVLIIPLSGACTVSADVREATMRIDIAGRAGVFDAITDFAYLPIRSKVQMVSAEGGRFAIATARATTHYPARHVRAADVSVELRGAGSCSRQVVNYATPDAIEADRIIVCEVLTPAGNWSSYPPHKHDEETDTETALEEIYYYEVRDASDGSGRPGMAYQRVYGTDDRPIDILAEVRSGDAVLIPHGWHGPSIAVPGYDLYYLNVMAGPGPDRAWRICDDPSHGWVRSTWPDQPVDPRLPMTRACS